MNFLGANGLARVVTGSACHVWGSAYLNGNVFDLNVSLPSDAYDSGAKTADQTLITTFVAPTMIYGAILMTPTTVITAGAGFTEIEQNTQGDFTLETEYQIVTSLQNKLPVAWTMVNHTYLAIIMEVDAEAELDSSSTGWKIVDRSGLVEPTMGNVEQGVTRAGYPTITTSGQTIIYDRSEGATYTKDEDHSSAEDPTTAPSSNQWG